MSRASGNVWLQPFSERRQRYSARDIQRVLPKLYDEFFKSGNRVIDPLAKSDSAITNFNDYFTRQDAWNWIQLRFNPNQRLFYVNPPLAFPNREDVFAMLHVLGRQQPTILIILARQFMEMFHWVSIILSRHTGWDVGMRLHHEIMRVAQLFVPFVAVLGPQEVYDFLDDMHQILGNRGFLSPLELIINTLDLGTLNQLYMLATAESARGDILGRKIINIVDNWPSTSWEDVRAAYH